MYGVEEKLLVNHCGFSEFLYLSPRKDIPYKGSFSYVIVVWKIYIIIIGQSVCVTSAKSDLGPRSLHAITQDEPQL